VWPQTPTRQVRQSQDRCQRDEGAQADVRGWSPGGSTVAVPVPRRDMRLSPVVCPGIGAVAGTRKVTAETARSRPIKVTTARLTACAIHRGLQASAL
jgi:hypothetical protein